MRLSFDDQESFKEAVGSFHFNNPSSDLNASLRMGSSSSSMPLDDSERDEGNITASDPITLRRLGSSSSLSIQETRRCEDIQACFNNPPTIPEFTDTSADVEEVYGSPRRSQGRGEDAER